MRQAGAGKGKGVSPYGDGELGKARAAARVARDVSAADLILEKAEVEVRATRLPKLGWHFGFQTRTK